MPTLIGSKIGVESTEQSLSLLDAQGNLRMDSSWLHSGIIEDARCRDVTEHQPASVFEHTRFVPDMVTCNPSRAQWQPAVLSVSFMPLAPSQQEIDFVNAGFGNNFNHGGAPSDKGY